VLAALLLLSMTAEERALAYLAVEVPKWSKQNGCFSCHNNGDAARALFVAKRLGPLADTTAWLLRPREWDKTQGDPRFSDKKLARIQFASALATAVETGAITDRPALIAAAEALVALQDSDGAWRCDTDATLGSPVTYGAALATYAARRALQTAGDPRFAPVIERARAWLASLKPSATVDVSAVILAVSRDPAGLVRAQTSDGGWGPYPGSPPEVFDTAIATLALASVKERRDLRPAIDRARRYLTSTQLASGGWPETTRPSGSQSYAQHISTSGWATLALLATR
jgi:squalene cyclase